MNSIYNEKLDNITLDFDTEIFSILNTHKNEIHNKSLLISQLEKELKTSINTINNNNINNININQDQKEKIYSLEKNINEINQKNNNKITELLIKNENYAMVCKDLKFDKKILKRLYFGYEKLQQEVCGIFDSIVSINDNLLLEKKPDGYNDNVDLICSDNINDYNSNDKSENYNNKTKTIKKHKSLRIISIYILAALRMCQILRYIRNKKDKNIGKSESKNVSKIDGNRGYNGYEYDSYNTYDGNAIFNITDVNESTNNIQNSSFNKILLKLNKIEKNEILNGKYTENNGKNDEKNEKYNKINNEIINEINNRKYSNLIWYKNILNIKKELINLNGMIVTLSAKEVMLHVSTKLLIKILYIIGW